MIFKRISCLIKGFYLFFLAFLRTDLLVQRAFSDIILLWNLDNSNRMDNEQENACVCGIYIP